ncbi:MAG: hypothetical protein AB7K09_17675, partial [Planctomycetota bacterium]
MRGRPVTTIATASRQQLAIAAPLVPAYCFESRRFAAASFAGPDDMRRAGDVLLGLLRRGVTGVPFGIVLDWMLLIEREWDFPSRTLEHSLADTGQIPRHQMLRGLPPEYENECLNPWLLSPWFRRVRDAMVLRGRSVARIVHLLEQVFEGLDDHLSYRVSHYDLEPHGLPQAFEHYMQQLQGAYDDDPLSAASRTAAGYPTLAELDERHPGVVEVVHDQVADFLRARLSQEPQPAPAPLSPGESEPVIVQPWRPTDVDIHELEHVEIFTSRVARLRCRRFGEIGQALGNPETRGLQRRIDIPEVVVNRDDETHYPAGGVAELTTSGSFENLLASELMYMEDDPGEVDIFSLKYVENELLYFVRDAGLLVRRRRRINIAVHDVPGFRIKYPGQRHPLDVWLDGMLARLIRDLFDFFEGEGLQLSAHWVFPSGRAMASRVAKVRSSGRGDAEAGAGAGATGDDAHELFDLLFRSEREKRFASFHMHDSVTSLGSWLKDNDHPLNQWVVLLPPPSDAAGSTPRRALASMLPTWTAMCRRGARPATAVTWTTVRTPSVMESDAAMPMLSHPATLRVLDAGEAEGLRDVRF